MPMTVVVTRNLPDRFRGFLASCMCEIAPGVYTAPRMSSAVRDRVWMVLRSWFEGEPDQAILMTWPDRKLRGGQIVRALGTPKHHLWDRNGVYLARRKVSEEVLEELGSLTTESSSALDEPPSTPA